MVVVAMRGILVSGSVGAIEAPTLPDQHYLYEPLESAQEGGELVARGLAGRLPSALAAVDMDERVARRAGTVADSDGRNDSHFLQEGRDRRGAVVATAHSGHGLGVKFLAQVFDQHFSSPKRL